MSLLVDATLTLNSAPPTGSAFPSGTTSLTWTKSRLFPEVESFSRSLSSAVNESLMPAGMTQVKRLFVRVYGGNVTLKLTSAVGTTQIVPCDEVFFLESTTQPLTAIAVSGTAEVEVLAAGE